MIMLREEKFYDEMQKLHSGIHTVGAKVDTLALKVLGDIHSGTEGIKQQLDDVTELANSNRADINLINKNISDNKIKRNAIIATVTTGGTIIGAVVGKNWPVLKTLLGIGTILLFIELIIIFKP